MMMMCRERKGLRRFGERGRETKGVSALNTKYDDKMHMNAYAGTHLAALGSSRCNAVFCNAHTALRGVIDLVGTTLIISESVSISIGVGARGACRKLRSTYM